MARGSSPSGQISVTAFWSLLKPMLVGCLPLGLPVAIVVYVLTRRAALFFRETRRKKLMDKARSIREAAKDIAGRKDMSQNA